MRQNIEFFLPNAEDLEPTDADLLIMHRTSSVTASVRPCILSRSDTGMTRTIFAAKMVDNSNDPRKSVEGTLIYERKSKNDIQYPTEKGQKPDVTRRTVHTGELMELPLDTEATFELYQLLGTLYQKYEQYGIPYGTVEYHRIDSSFKNFLAIIQENPEAAKMIGNPANYDLVKLLLKLITNAESTASLANALQNLENANIEQLSQSISIERLNRVISLIEDNLDNDLNEEFWQKDVFTENQWILAQLFAAPCTIFQEKAYVGGKSIENSAGNLCDFLYQNELTHNVILIEIKKPQTSIIHRQYRQTYSFSEELSGAVNQVIHYRDSITKEFNELVRNGDRPFFAFTPKCVIIIGKLSNMNEGQIAAFENYRHCLNNIEIITYDEILTRLTDLRSLLVEPSSLEGFEEIEETMDFPF